jgi:hypothetical protein
MGRRSFALSAPPHLEELFFRADADPDVPLLLADFVDPTPPRGEFRTATREAGAGLPSLEVAVCAPALRILPLEKTARNPYEEFVFVGRASTCDVILRDVSVSKSHAVFERTRSGWLLRDNRSHNGTYLGERRLDAGERAPLGSGQALRFGAYAVYFVMPVELRRILETMGFLHE